MASSNKKSLPLDRKIDQKGFFLSIFKKIPLAPIVNFLALLSLFAVITFLHHIERPKSARVKEVVAVPEQTSVQAQVEAPKKARVPRPSRPLDAAVNKSAPSPSPLPRGERVRERVTTLRNDIKEEIEPKLGKINYDKQELSSPRSFDRLRMVSGVETKRESLGISSAKEIPVEELDTETARLSYLAQNKTTTKIPPAASQPAPPKPQPASSDFIPFEERFKER